MNIYGFYHIAAINDYEKIVNDQLTSIKKSGLLCKTKTLHITIIGGENNLLIVNSFLDKLNITNYNIDVVNGLDNFEFPTLEKIYNLSLIEDFYCYYLHTKGVSIDENNYTRYGNKPLQYIKTCVGEWREYMEYFLLEQHEQCMCELKYSDAVGCFISEEPVKHFTGNFWWSKSEYIKKLNSIEDLNKLDRYQAEFWISDKNNGKLKSLHQPSRHYYAYIEKCDFNYKKINVDVVVISNSKSDELIKLTEKTLKTLYSSEENVNFFTYIVESSDVDFTHIDENIKMVKPDGSFGYNKYLNLGRKLGCSEYVCLCNNDLEFHEKWAINIINLMKKDEKLLSVTPYSINPHLIVYNLNLNSEVFYGYKTTFNVGGWCIFQKRTIYDIIGDLDENFVFWYADNDYSKTLENYNIKHALVTNSFVNHMTSKTLYTLPTDEIKKLTEEQIKIFNNKWNK